MQENQFFRNLGHDPQNLGHDHRFRLRPYSQGKKTVCPSCGKRSFVPYVDGATGEILDETCGRCDHESSCGYHLTPREFFADHPKPMGDYKPEPRPTPDLVNFGSVSVWDSRWTDKYNSDFARALGKYFDTELVHLLVDKYRLQAHGVFKNVMFPNIDRFGTVQSVMVVGYHSDLHRNHVCFRYYGNETWKRKMLTQHPNGVKYGSCLFGEHLLTKFPKLPVVVVESQKSAVIGSAVYPEYVWLASCGCQQFKPELLSCLKGRKTVVLPDKGCEDKWRSVVDGVSKQDGMNILLRPIMQEFSEYGENSDFADVILDRLTKRELPISLETLTFEYLCRKPNMKTFFDKMGIDSVKRVFFYGQKVV